MLEVEIAIIGGGPHALALLSKILEKHIGNREEKPSNRKIFRRNKDRIRACIDFEQNTQSSDRQIRRWCSASRSSKLKQERLKILRNIAVIDPSGKWLSQWRNQFSALNIKNLRSSISAHPDPVDEETLSLFANDKKLRGIDTTDIAVDRSEVFHGPFEVPSSRFFETFCDSVISRYNLENFVRQGFVENLSVLSQMRNSKKADKPGFQLQLSDGEVIMAKRVVVATGTLNRPNFPDWASQALINFKNIPEVPKSLVHANWIMKKERSYSYMDKKGNVCIVGGGLTAGHVALSFLRLNKAVCVTLVARSNISIRQFDLDLKWMGRKRPEHLASYWASPTEAKVNILKQSKNGGSMTPEVFFDLEKYNHSGRFKLVENTQIIDVQWVTDCWNATFDSGERREFNHIICATGNVTDFETDQLFSNVQEYFLKIGKPVETISGLPNIDDDLRLHKDLDLFVMGHYAALKIGPGALNLMGGNASASRIADALPESLTVRDKTKLNSP